MPSWLANVEPHIIFRILREDLLETNNKQFKFSQLVDILDIRIQQARHEQLFISLCNDNVRFFPLFNRSGLTDLFTRQVYQY
jgi:hypothetical protein